MNKGGSAMVTCHYEIVEVEGHACTIVAISGECWMEIAGKSVYMIYKSLGFQLSATNGIFGVNYNWFNLWMDERTPKWKTLHAEKPIFPISIHIGHRHFILWRSSTTPFRYLSVSLSSTIKYSSFRHKQMTKQYLSLYISINNIVYWYIYDSCSRILYGTVI